MARISNPYSYEESLVRLRDYLSKIQGSFSISADAIELLDKAVSKAEEDEAYAQKMKEAILRGSTIEYRDLFSVFGEYFSPPREEFPFYPFSDSVNLIDTALYHIKRGDEEEAISFFNGQHGTQGD